jgi:hypothetical protein
MTRKNHAHHPGNAAYHVINHKFSAVHLHNACHYGRKRADNREAIIIVIVLVTTAPVLWKLFLGKKKNIPPPQAG